MLCLFAAPNSVGHVSASAASTFGRDISRQCATSCSVLRGLINLQASMADLRGVPCGILHGDPSTPQHRVYQLDYINLLAVSQYARWRDSLSYRVRRAYAHRVSLVDADMIPQRVRSPRTLLPNTSIRNLLPCPIVLTNHLVALDVVRIIQLQELRNRHVLRDLRGWVRRRVDSGGRHGMIELWTLLCMIDADADAAVGRTRVLFYWSMIGGG